MAKEKYVDFYADKNLTRLTIVITPDFKRRLQGLSKSYRATPGSVVETVLGSLSFDQLKPYLTSIYNTDGRSSRNPGGLTQADVLKKLKVVDPERLAKIIDILDSEEGSGE